jgi:hypothetical protein
MSGASEQQAAAHATGEHRRADPGLRPQIEHIHHLSGAAAGVGPAHPVVAAVIDERLLNVEEPSKVDVLLGEPHHPPRLRVVVGAAEDRDLPRTHPDEVAHGADERRLSRSVRPEQAEELSVGDFEIERVKGEQSLS